MTQLLKTVQKNKTVLFLEKISSGLLIVAALSCVYLYGQFDGFFRGKNYATALYTEGHPKYSFSGSGRPVYELILENYFFVLIVLLIVLLVHLLANGITSKLINLFLLCFAVSKCFSIFRLKKELFNSENFESQYFDIVRQTIGFDIVGATAIGSLLVIQLILVLLILNERKKTKIA